jgi:predicted nucleotidyltransferase
MTIDDTAIERSARAILAACPEGSRVILFGSRARGDARPDSDVDFMVIEPEVPSRMTEAARLARVIRPFCVAADIVVVDQATFEDWKDVPDSVFNEAATYGKVMA